MRNSLFKCVRQNNLDGMILILKEVVQCDDNSTENALKMLRRRDAEGKLMLQIALFYGFFELSKYLLKEWPSHLEMLPVIIDDMTVYHLALGSAHQVPSLTIKHEEDNYIEIFTILSQTSTFTGSQFGIDTKNRLGQTPLMLVAKLGFPRLAEHLIKEMKASI